MSPEQSYEDHAAALLAQIADLLLTGKQDWATLERLQEAINPPKVEDRVKRGPFKGKTGVIAGSEIKESNGSIEDIIKKTYEETLRQQTENSILHYSNPTTTNTAAATWTEYSVKPRRKS